MKRTLLLLLILITTIIGGCGNSNNQFTILVSGTTGMEVTGALVVVNSDGSSTNNSVSGKTPLSYEVEGKIVSCSFQKGTEKGLLKVEILKDSKVIKTAETNVVYGVAAVATQ